MAKSKNLKRSLKAADKRRRRRSAAAVANPTLAPSRSTDERQGDSVDPVGLIVAEIVQHSSSVSDDNSDAMIVAALRACLKGSVPKGDRSRVLAERLRKTSAQITERQFRDTLSNLLRTASEMQDAGQPCAFRDYMHVIAN